MDIPEIYWEIISEICSVLQGGILPGYFLACLVKPFMNSKRAAWLTGMLYAGMILFIWFEPIEVSSFFAYVTSIVVTFLGMAAMDYRNIRQKFFLCAIFFLLRWTSMGLARFFCNAISEALIYHPVIAAADLIWQFVIFLFITLLRIVADYVFLWVAVHLVLREYADKRENMTKREFILLIFPFLPIIATLYGFTLLSDIYEADTGEYIWYAYPAYTWLEAVYNLISFITMLAIIIVYQHIKKRQSDKRQEELLQGQIENMKHYISEVEKLYGSIRTLRHDMGNHMMTLEHLYEKREYDEAGKYAAKLQEEFGSTGWEVKSGNPVTDVILTEKKKEAEEKGILFECTFSFPAGMDINAFDMSVILNNAVSNAIEAAVKSENPYIILSSRRRRNTYMIEVRNSVEGTVMINEESGLPETTKANKSGHGIGLVSIQNMAQKYFGGIDIRQENGEFLLNVMLMLGDGR